MDASSDAQMRHRWLWPQRKRENAPFRGAARPGAKRGKRQAVDAKVGPVGVKKGIGERRPPGVFRAVQKAGQFVGVDVKVGKLLEHRVRRDEKAQAAGMKEKYAIIPAPRDCGNRSTASSIATSTEIRRNDAGRLKILSGSRDLLFAARLAPMRPNATRQKASVPE